MTHDFQHFLLFFHIRPDMPIYETIRMFQRLVLILIHFWLAAEARMGRKGMGTRGQSKLLLSSKSWPGGISGWGKRGFSGLRGSYGKGEVKKR